MSPVGTGNTGTGFALTADGVNLTTGDTRVELALNGSDLVLGVAPVGGTVQSSTSVTIPGIAGTSLCIDGQAPLSGALHMNLGIDGNDVLLNLGDGNVTQTWRQPHIISAVGIHGGAMHTGSTGFNLSINGNDLTLNTHNSNGNGFSTVSLPVGDSFGSVYQHYLPVQSFVGVTPPSPFDYDWVHADYEYDYFLSNRGYDPAPQAGSLNHIDIPPGVWRFRWELQVVSVNAISPARITMHSHLRKVSDDSIVNHYVVTMDLIAGDIIHFERIGNLEEWMYMGVEAQGVLSGGQDIELRPCFIAQRIL